MHGLNITILRLANPYGGRQRINYSQGCPHLLDRAINSLPLTIMGDGSVIRDFLHIYDVVHSICLSCSYRGPVSTFNIGSGTGTSINDLVEIIESIVPTPIEVTYKESRSFDVPTNILCIKNAENELRWRPMLDPYQGIQSFLS